MLNYKHICALILHIASRHHAFKNEPNSTQGEIRHAFLFLAQCIPLAFSLKLSLKSLIQKFMIEDQTFRIQCMVSAESFSSYYD